jgi:hypothetical protein
MALVAIRVKIASFGVADVEVRGAREIMTSRGV